MSLGRLVLSIASLFLGLSTAVAQQTETKAPAQQTETKAPAGPPLFQGIMVDAKGNTVGRLLFDPTHTNNNTTFVVRRISGVWVTLRVPDLKTGFDNSPLQPAEHNSINTFYQSADCTGQAYFDLVGFQETGQFTDKVTALAYGIVATVPPATSPSIYFAGTPASVLTIQSIRQGGSCGLWGPIGGTHGYVGPVQNVPLSNLGLTPPFSVK
jgi:hypothetical protein